MSSGDTLEEARETALRKWKRCASRGFTIEKILVWNRRAGIEAPTIERAIGVGMVKALVMTGFGLNCDLETSYALEVAGAASGKSAPEQSHFGREINEFAISIFVIGGGFSWGDDHGAGVIMAMRLKHRLQDQISAFVDSGGIVIGICNGFQVLVNLGLLPGFNRGRMKREVALIANDCGGFRDQWVNLSVNSASHCVLSRDIRDIELPIRHGEGKFFAETAIIEKLISNGAGLLALCEAGRRSRSWENFLLILTVQSRTLPGYAT